MACICVDVNWLHQGSNLQVFRVGPIFPFDQICGKPYGCATITHSTVICCIGAHMWSYVGPDQNNFCGRIYCKANRPNPDRIRNLGILEKIYHDKPRICIGGHIGENLGQFDHGLDNHGLDDIKSGDRLVEGMKVERLYATKYIPSQNAQVPICG